MKNVSNSNMKNPDHPKYGPQNQKGSGSTPEMTPSHPNTAAGSPKTDEDVDYRLAMDVKEEYSDAEAVPPEVDEDAEYRLAKDVPARVDLLPFRRGDAESIHLGRQRVGEAL